MKKLLSTLLLLGTLMGYAQSDSNISSKITKILSDTRRFAMVQNAGHYAVPENRLAAFDKAVDSIRNRYDSAVSGFFRNRFTPEELDELYAFYETQAGSKVAQDVQKLSVRNFSPFKEIIKADVLSADAYNQGSFSPELPQYFGMSYYLGLWLEYEAMWKDPQKESVFRQNCAERMPLYDAAVNKYFAERYNAEETQAIKSFYTKGAGAKLQTHLAELARIQFDAYSEWLSSYQEIFLTYKK